MRTRLTIMGIALAILVAAAVATVTLGFVLGAWRGLATAAGCAAGLLVLYRVLVQPWHARWGASAEEVSKTMPGDELIENAASTTRAITIAAPPAEIWPWLTQIGYGRAGWYSYDWIDNDARRSAERIVPELQHITVGDKIPMLPGMGPRVRAMEPGRFLLAGDEEGGTWCLMLAPFGEGCTRLVSRWRQHWRLTPATVFWILLSDPGAFLMERKMLKGIKQRVERAGRHVPVHSAPVGTEGER
jgi:hypothetical protein